MTAAAPPAGRAAVGTAAGHWSPLAVGCRLCEGLGAVGASVVPLAGAAVRPGAGPSASDSASTSLGPPFARRLGGPARLVPCGARRGVCATQQSSD